MAVHIETLDLRFQGVDGGIAAFLVESGSRRILIECGPSTTTPTLLEELSRRGRTPSELDALLVTHVHLDHAGAAGWWARQGVPVYCHPRAARHLIDPTRLEAGARQVYGADFDRLWGEVPAAPADRVHVLEDGQSYDLDGIQVIALDTPGHARHHHAYQIEDQIFTGDVAGVRLGGSDYLSPAAAPPQFDLEAYLHSLDRLAELNPRRLLLTHFGEVRSPLTHLQAYRQRLQQVVSSFKAGIEAGRTDAELAWQFSESESELARTMGVTGPEWERYELVNSCAMGAMGLSLSLRA